MRASFDVVAANTPKPKPAGGRPLSDGPKKPEPRPTGGTKKK